MSNSKQFNLPGGDIAFATVPVNPSTGEAATPGGAVASDSVVLDLDSLGKTFNYTGSQLNHVEVLHGGETYRKTYTYSGGVLSTISGWVKQ